MKITSFLLFLVFLGGSAITAAVLDFVLGIGLPSKTVLKFCEFGITLVLVGGLPLLFANKWTNVTSRRHYAKRKR